MGLEAQIRSLVRIGRRNNQIESDEGQLIHKAFNLNDVTADAIMIPREHVVALPVNITITEAAKRVMETPHSRYPVYEENLDTIAGIALERDVLLEYFRGNGAQSIESLLRDALFVHDEAKADDLLVLFKSEHSHLAIVRSGGTTVGIVTLVDVLEELVGAIDDEEDIRKRGRLNGAGMSSAM